MSKETKIQTTAKSTISDDNTICITSGQITIPNIDEELCKNARPMFICSLDKDTGLLNAISSDTYAHINLLCSKPQVTKEKFFELRERDFDVKNNINKVTNKILDKYNKPVFPMQSDPLPPLLKYLPAKVDCSSVVARLQQEYFQKYVGSIPELMIGKIINDRDLATIINNVGTYVSEHPDYLACIGKNVQRLYDDIPPACKEMLDPFLIGVDPTSDEYKAIISSDQFRAIRYSKEYQSCLDITRTVISSPAPWCMSYVKPYGSKFIITDEPGYISCLSSQNISSLTDNQAGLDTCDVCDHLIILEISVAPSFWIHGDTSKIKIISPDEIVISDKKVSFKDCNNQSSTIPPMDSTLVLDVCNSSQIFTAESTIFVTVDNYRKLQSHGATVVNVYQLNVSVELGGEILNAHTACVRSNCVTNIHIDEPDQVGVIYNPVITKEFGDNTCTDEWAEQFTQNLFTCPDCEDTKDIFGENSQEYLNCLETNYKIFLSIKDLNIKYNLYKSGSSPDYDKTKYTADVHDSHVYKSYPKCESELLEFGPESIEFKTSIVRKYYVSTDSCQCLNCYFIEDKSSQEYIKCVREFCYKIVEPVSICPPELSSINEINKFYDQVQSIDYNNLNELRVSNLLMDASEIQLLIESGLESIKLGEAILLNEVPYIQDTYKYQDKELFIRKRIVSDSDILEYIQPIRDRIKDEDVDFLVNNLKHSLIQIQYGASESDGDRVIFDSGLIDKCNLVDNSETLHSKITLEDSVTCVTNTITGKTTCFERLPETLPQVDPGDCIELLSDVSDDTIIKLIRQDDKLRDKLVSESLIDLSNNISHEALSYVRYSIICPNPELVEIIKYIEKNNVDNITLLIERYVGIPTFVLGTEYIRDRSVLTGVDIIREDVDTGITSPIKPVSINAELFDNKEYVVRRSGVLDVIIPANVIEPVASTEIIEIIQGQLKPEEGKVDPYAIVQYIDVNIALNVDDSLYDNIKSSVESIKIDTIEYLRRELGVPVKVTVAQTVDLPRISLAIKLRDDIDSIKSTLTPEYISTFQYVLNKLSAISGDPLVEVPIDVFYYNEKTDTGDNKLIVKLGI